MNKTIIIGLGNPILGDDGVGWRVVEALQERVEAQGVETDKLASGGIGLMERLVGYQQAVIVDAIATGSYPTGSVRVFPLEALENSFAGHLGSAHESSLQTALQVGRDLGASLPDRVTIVAIESPHVYDFSSELSPAVEKAIPSAVQAVSDLLSKTKTGGV
jgi:hydrogenase maturation protease